MFLRPTKFKIIIFIVFCIVGLISTFYSIIFLGLGFMQMAGKAPEYASRLSASIIDDITIIFGIIFSFPVFLLLYNKTSFNFLENIGKSLNIQFYSTPYFEILSLIILVIYWYFLTCFVDFIFKKLLTNFK